MWANRAQIDIAIKKLIHRSKGEKFICIENWKIDKHLYIYRRIPSWIGMFMNMYIRA